MILYQFPLQLEGQAEGTDRILNGFKSSPISVRIFIVIIRDIINNNNNDNNVSLYCKFTLKCKPNQDFFFNDSHTMCII